MMGLIGFCVGFIGFVLHQLIEKIADVKWEITVKYIEVKRWWEITVKYIEVKRWFRKNKVLNYLYLK